MTGFWHERLRLAIALGMGVVAALLWWWLLNTDDIDEDIEDRW
jgi:hypothetical protein